MVLRIVTHLFAWDQSMPQGRSGPPSIKIPTDELSIAARAERLERSQVACTPQQFGCQGDFPRVAPAGFRRLHHGTAPRCSDAPAAYGCGNHRASFDVGNGSACKNVSAEHGLRISSEPSSCNRSLARPLVLA